MNGDFQQIAVSSIWRCLGPGSANGELYRVLDAEPDDVIAGSAGHIYRGPGRDFIRHFRLVREATGSSPDTAAA